MWRNRREDYGGCSIEAHKGRLRLRWRWMAANGTDCHVARAVGLDDTEENRGRLEPLSKVITSLVRAGKDPAPILDEMLSAGGSGTETVAKLGNVVTVETYFREFIERMKPPLVRKAQARDLRRHIEGYILPRIGGVPLSELRPKDIRALQAELLATKSRKTKKLLSVKTVKNAISGSLCTMIGQAVLDEIVTADLFAGLKWPKWNPPGADPLSDKERDSVLKWFAEAAFAFQPLAGSTKRRWLAHPPFHAYVHTLLWNFMRPS
jgi:integrase-like protein